MSKRTNKSGPVTIITPASALPTVATLPVAPAPVAKAPTVALRGGPAVQAVALTGVAYRVTAPHNVAWWAQVQAAIAAGDGKATVASLVPAVPAIMVGYLIRRGYLKAVAA